MQNKFSDLSLLKFEIQNNSLMQFLAEKSKAQALEKIEIDRLPDADGVRGDVTDLRINIYTGNRIATLNISLKHKHQALKHPRLTRVPNWIGLESTIEAKKYLDAYNEIWESFFRKGRQLLPEAKRFNELKAKDEFFIEKNLYEPLYHLVGDFLEKNIFSEMQVVKLFEFLVGRLSFIKFIDYGGEIEIRDFSEIPKPNSVIVGYNEKGYLYLTFSNGWRISGRLHTATEWLKPSIKFDMQPVNLDEVIPAIRLYSRFQETL